MLYVGIAQAGTFNGLDFAQIVALYWGKRLTDTSTIILDALQLVDQVSQVIVVWRCQTHFACTPSASVLAI